MDILHSIPRLSGHSSYENAPALLRNSLGQRTSVDYPTERTIQTTLRDSFLTRTVLCIAHRPRTILACDDGKVVEFDTLLNLFAKTDSLFRGMCDSCGIDGFSYIGSFDRDNLLETGRRGDIYPRVLSAQFDIID